MKHLLTIVLFLFTVNAYAVECVLEWDASVSADVTHYNLYNADAVMKDKIETLTYSFECVPGVFTLTAVNKFGIESERTEPIEVKKPDFPLGFRVEIVTP